MKSNQDTKKVLDEYYSRVPLDVRKKIDGGDGTMFQFDDGHNFLGMGKPISS